MTYSISIASQLEVIHFSMGFDANAGE